MRLSTGARLGSYEIVSLLGTGGMGAVYKAIDRRLDRHVAIKVLHRSSLKLRQRFEREARVVAALQHPRICTLIDIGVHDGTDYLVMEYLDGRTLVCPQPLEKVLEYGLQIADALDAVHRQGITHRDLKPGNIIVTRDGVKLLDFGIAKAVTADTITQEGAVVGTPGYMAPEQVRGDDVDHRTDIYALGCVLHEMATGQRTTAAALPHDRLEWVVRTCLAVEPDDRWQSARDVKRLLESIVDERVTKVQPRQTWWWTAAVALIGLAGIAAAWMFKPAVRPQLYQLSIVPPADASFLSARNREGGMAVSPDGGTIAFVALTAGKAQLWLRRLDSIDAQLVPGTDGAFYPFWSPDSRWIAFFTPDRLMRVPSAGGVPQTIAPTDPRSLGGAWGADDVILVTSDSNNISRVAASGGALTRLLAGRWPHFLPDGKRFLFSNAGAVWVGSVTSGESPRQIVEGSALKPAYSNGHVLFVRDRNLLAQRVDPATLERSGEAFPIAALLPGSLGDNPGEFSATSDGLLAYAIGEALSALVWRDRSGKRADELAGGAALHAPRISPDGQRVAFARTENGNTDIWIADIARRATTRLTFDAAMDRWPVWSPDGTTITYSSGTNLEQDLYRRAADGSGNAERLTNHPSPQHPMDWSSDNRYLSFTRNEPGFGTNLMVLPAGGDAYTFLRTIVSEAHSQLDPRTQRWIVYSSDDSGRREIYVKPFTPPQPAADARWQISVAGGTMPRWRRDGTELYYWGLDGRIMAASVDGSGSAFKWSTPVTVFQAGAPTLRVNDINFDVMPDGQRFLVLEPADRPGAQPLVVVSDWLAATKGSKK